MPAAVVETNEISLNGVYYPITRPIRSTLASIYPAKVVIGDTTKDSQLRSSIIAWSDWRGGIGVNRMEGAGEVNRAWYSTCQLRYKNHLVLPGLATESSTPTHSLTDATIGALNTLSSEVYAFWNGSTSESPKLFKYNNTSDSWGSALTQSATDQVTDSVVFTNSGGTTYLVFAHYDVNGSGYTYSSDGSSWTTDTTDTKFVTVWDERLWGISNVGQLWYATTIGTDVNDAVLPLPDGSVTALFVARNAMGIPIIYAATTRGLYAHNADNAMWEDTQMDFPTHPENGKGTVRWRDSVYIPSGNGIYKYINGNNAAVITIVGPDRDDGLPSDKRGSIRHMAGSHNELLVGIDASTAPSIVRSTDIPYQWVSHQGSMVISPDSGYSTILGYNEMGWEVKWQAGTSGKGFDSIHVSDAYDKHRAWWGHNDIVHFMDLPSDIINPSEVSEFSYALEGVHETPWFNAGQSEIDKLALNLRIEAQGLSTTEKIKVEYATDYTESYTTAEGTLNSPTMFAQTEESDSATTLDGAITSTGATSVPVASASGLEVGDLIIVGSEHMTISSISSNTLTVTRASNSTTAATHSDGDTVAIGGSSGTYRYTFASGAGTKFRAIKFKLTLNRSTATTTGREKFETPDVVSLTLEWRKKISPKWGHTVEVDLNNTYKGNEAKDLRSALVSAIESTTLVEFTFRDDGGGTRNYYVDVVSAVGVEYTGYDERGATQITVVEP
jgi:hypothetical protein